MSWQIKGNIAPPASGLISVVQQAMHGFVAGNIVRESDTGFVKALADSIADALVVGIVAEVLTTDQFKLQVGGRVPGLSGLVAGSLYYLSETVAGELTLTEPTISKPLFVADSTTSGYFINWRAIAAEEAASVPLLVEGTTALRAVPTIGATAGSLLANVTFQSGGAWTMSTWLLISGTNADDEDGGIIRPDDYADPANTKVWVKVGGL